MDFSNWADRKGASFHESGHGLIAEHLGVRVTGLDINKPGWRLWGWAGHEGRQPDHIERLLCVSGAASQALGHCVGSSAPPPTAPTAGMLGGDVAIWRLRVPELDADFAAEVDALYRDLEQTCTILIAHWTGLKGLAAEVEMDSRASGDRVRSRLASGRPPTTWPPGRTEQAQLLAATALFDALITERTACGLRSEVSNSTDLVTRSQRPGERRGAMEYSQPVAIG